MYKIWNLFLSSIDNLILKITLKDKFLELAIDEGLKMNFENVIIYFTF